MGQLGVDFDSKNSSMKMVFGFDFHIRCQKLDVIKKSDSDDFF